MSSFMKVFLMVMAGFIALFTVFTVAGTFFGLNGLLVVILVSFFTGLAGMIASTIADKGDHK
tara:strand:- start:1583 stop:1768 length:186 start_codon:yes stop_codon:yes gene_type:complete